jgi:vancomycin permeability regulator SanA
LKVEKYEREKIRKQLLAQEEQKQEYYSETRLVELIHEFWKGTGIELDPATSKTANKLIRAKKIFTKEQGEETFKNTWKSKTVYVNAPFDRGIYTKFAD